MGPCGNFTRTFFFPVNSPERHAIFAAWLRFLYLHFHVVVLIYFQTKFQVIINIHGLLANIQLYPEHERFHCRKVLMFRPSVFKPGELSCSRARSRSVFPWGTFLSEKEHKGKYYLSSPNASAISSFSEFISWSSS